MGKVQFLFYIDDFTESLSIFGDNLPISWGRTETAGTGVEKLHCAEAAAHGAVSVPEQTQSSAGEVYGVQKGVERDFHSVAVAVSEKHAYLDQIDEM